MCIEADTWERTDIVENVLNKAGISWTEEGRRGGGEAHTSAGAASKASCMCWTGTGCSGVYLRCIRAACLRRCRPARPVSRKHTSAPWPETPIINKMWFKLLHYRIWIRDVFWLGALGPGTKGAGSKTHHESRCCANLIDNL